MTVLTAEDTPLQIGIATPVRRVSAERVRVPAGAVPKEMAKREARRKSGRQEVRKSLGSRYRLLERLGEGGTGTVYRAQDLLLDMPVAVKILAPGLSRDVDAVNTLRHEARITLGLTHRHVVRLHNLEKIASTFFLVMEYVEGDTLRDIIGQYRSLPADTATQMISVCADALAYAHRHGILHNDLKPENILLSRDGVLKVIDFGIACLINREWHGEYVQGTPVYMSPEQLMGEPLDVHTDIYALGMIAYELLTGYPAVSPGDHAGELGPRRDLQLTNVPDEVKQVIAKATAFDRYDRWDSVLDFAHAFTIACGGDPSQTEPCDEDQP